MGKESGGSGGQSSSEQQIPENLNPIVEIFCEPWLLPVLGWQDHTQLVQILNNIPAGFDSSRDGDGNPICRYADGLMTGRALLQGIEQGSLTAMCQYGLPESYVRGELQGAVYAASITEESSPANIILIQRDVRQNVPAAIRGIALLRVSYRPDPSVGFYNDGIKLTSTNTNNGLKYPVRNSETTSVSSEKDIVPTQGINMEVLVYGNATTPRSLTQAMQQGEVRFASGGRTLRAFQLLGALLPQGIGLHALETVITLYHKFGWKFINNCGEGEQTKYTQAVGALRDFYKVNGVADEQLWGHLGNQTGEERHIAYIKGLDSILNVFRPFAYHVARATRKSTEDQGYLENAIEAIQTHSRDNGYRMLLCQPQNAMWYVIPGTEDMQINQHTGRPMMPVVPALRGGRRKRRRRKRTKKRALKKRHRRTKRKRKRKTRRKRGGKHKLSNKKCKMLRHQHSKLIHHVNMVGKALRVQCKKRL